MHRQHLAAAADDNSREVLADSLAPVLAAGLVDWVDSDHAITDEVRLEPTPGHTRGHVSVRIRSAGAEAVITGDLMHHPIQCCDPRLETRFNVDSEQTLDCEKALEYALGIIHPIYADAEQDIVG